MRRQGAIIFLLGVALAGGTSHEVAAQCVVDTCSTCGRPAYGDADGDSIPDALEYDLAHAFFPAIFLGYSTVDFFSTYFANGKSAPYTIVPIPPRPGLCDEVNKCLEIRYGTPYYQDFGDMGFGGHLGDSEYYAAVLRRTTSWSSAQADASQWQLIRDFTSAHEGTSADSSVLGAYGYCPPDCHRWDNDGDSCRANRTANGCIWFPGFCSGSSGASPNYQPCSWNTDEGSCFFAGGSCHWIPSSCGRTEVAGCYSSTPLATAATIHAAEKTHALYHTDQECDAGGFNPIGIPVLGPDNCPNTSLVNLRDYKSNLLQNVGNWNNYAYFDTTLQHPDFNVCSLYNVWGTAPFGDSGSTPYSEHFDPTKRSFDWLLNPNNVAATSSSGCGEASCVSPDGQYISHFTGSNCDGTESYYLPYDGWAYHCRPDLSSGAQCGTIHRTVTNRSYRYGGQCYSNAWPDGNTLSDFVTVYRGACGEGSCVSPDGQYISHFTGPNCDGTESYYLPYDGWAYHCRPDLSSGAQCGTIHRTVTNRSYRYAGQCYPNAWPGGNTLSDFVTVYR